MNGNFYFAAQKDAHELISLLNKALASITTEECEALERKWFGTSNQQDISENAISLSPEEEIYLRNHPVLQVAFDIDWPPVEFSDPKHCMNGMAADYLNKMAEILGVRFKPSRPRPWPDMLSSVKKGECDFLSAVSPSPQRSEWMDFTDPYIAFPVVVITGKDVQYISSMSDLLGKPVTVVKEYAVHDFLLSHNPELSIVPVRKVKEVDQRYL
jgi:ABC-type amino acid transport substrate-binding protein